ncbi:MAG: HD domain-containing protein [Nanoarchaeales archaeon]|nr:HD domain-containing protein [Nanoarchaeales archaeon]
MISQKKINIKREVLIKKAKKETLNNFIFDEKILNILKKHFLENIDQEIIIKNFTKEEIESGLASVDYWKFHGELVGKFMEKVAEDIGEDKNIYSNLGIIHDIDYLKFSHHSGNYEEPHPFPLANKLLELKFPTKYILAILEHAGYIGAGNKSFSSRLSAALSACDDLATLICTKQIDDKGNIITNDFNVILNKKAIKLIRGVEIPTHFLTLKSNCLSRVLSDVDNYVNEPLDMVYDKNKKFELL